MFDTAVGTCGRFELATGGTTAVVIFISCISSSSLSSVCSITIDDCFGFGIELLFVVGMMESGGTNGSSCSVWTRPVTSMEMSKEAGVYDHG